MRPRPPAARSCHCATSVVKWGARNAPGRTASEQRLGARARATVAGVAKPPVTSRASAAARRAPGPARRDQRIVGRRRPREPGEQRGLAEAELGGVGAEVEPGRGFHADGALPQRHPVEVLLEDGLLRHPSLEPERPERLGRLPRPGAGGRAQQARELHRDGRSAGDDPARPQVRHGRASQGAEIDARVAIEPPVLDREECREQIGIHLGQRHPAAEAAIGGAGAAEREAGAVEEDEAGGGGVEKVCGERAGEPEGERDGGEADRCRERRHAQAPHLTSPSPSR